MLPPTLLDRQREIGIQQVEIDARPARLLQRWIRLFHVANIGRIPSYAKPDFCPKRPLRAAAAPFQSAPTRPRLDFMPARCFFDWIIRAFWPRLFWRLRRRFLACSSCLAAAAARFISSSFAQSSPQASSRLTV